MLRFKRLKAELVSESGDLMYTNTTWRAKIPGGWLVGWPGSNDGMTFVPDPEHTWDGNSLP